jgi:hypothetical protein
METRDADATSRLKVNLGAWTSALDGLRHRLKNLQTAVLPLVKRGEAVSEEVDLVMIETPSPSESVVATQTNGATRNGVESVSEVDENQPMDIPKAETRFEPLPPPPYRHWRQFQAARPLSPEKQAAVRERAEATLGECSSLGVARLESDSNDVVIDSCPGFIGDLRPDLIGKTLDDVFGVLMGCFGSDAKIADVHVGADRTERRVEFQNSGGESVTIRAVSLPRFDQSGEILGITTLIGRETEVPAAS